MTKTLYLVRHGITDWNVQRKMQGHTNIPLNDMGRDQATALQVFFQNHTVDKIFSSDLDRALQTAKIATQSENVMTLEGLREVCLGDIEGLSEPEIVSRYGREVWEQWISTEPQANFAFPGGETHHESLNRFKTHLMEIFKNHNFKKAAVFTHGLMIRRLGHHLCPDLKELLPIPNCGVFELQWNEDTLSFQGPVFQL